MIPGEIFSSPPFSFLAPQTLAAFESLCNSVSFNRGEHFIKADESADKFGIVAKGMFRYYYLNDKGNEYTKGFFQEGSLLSSYSAMISNEPSPYGIQALEDAAVIVVGYDEWKAIEKNDAAWKDFLIFFLQKGYRKKEKREREFLLFDASARYESFLEEYPGLENRISQHLIASYLGITPVALSRIRSRMKH